MRCITFTSPILKRFSFLIPLFKTKLALKRHFMMMDDMILTRKMILVCAVIFKNYPGFVNKCFLDGISSKYFWQYLMCEMLKFQLNFESLLKSFHRHQFRNFYHILLNENVSNDMTRIYLKTSVMLRHNKTSRRSPQPPFPLRIFCFLITLATVNMRFLG